MNTNFMTMSNLNPAYLTIRLAQLGGEQWLVVEVSPSVNLHYLHFTDQESLHTTIDRLIAQLTTLKSKVTY